MVLDKENPFAVIEKKGKFYFHKLRSNLKMSSIASIRQSKILKERVYLYTSEEDQSLNIIKIPLVFDPRASPERVENFCIK
jgi:hypothetical protein